jgi:hypothetical protein
MCAITFKPEYFFSCKAGELFRNNNNIRGNAIKFA